MKHLLVVIPCGGDAAHVAAMIQYQVPKCRHRVLLAYTGSPNLALIAQAQDRFAAVYTVKVSEHGGWPRQHNAFWQTAAREVERCAGYGASGWLYWEMDALPLKQSWLDDLSAAYVKARTPFFGHVDAHQVLHSTAIYPVNISEYCVNALLAKSNPFETYIIQESKGRNVKVANPMIVRHFSLYNKTGAGRQGHCHISDVQKYASAHPGAVLYCGVTDKKVSTMVDTFHHPSIAPLYTISVLCLNNWDLTEKCLDSIIQHSEHYELIITNNGSTDETAEKLKEYANRPNVRVVTNAENKGFQEPNEDALKMARGRFFVLFNNDMEACAGWLDALRAPFDSDPLMALTGIAKTCCRISDEFKGTSGDDNNPEYIEGGCLMAPAALLREHGMFSSYLKFIYWEDTDLGLRMRELGYHIATVPIGISHHHRSATTRNLDLEEVKKQNHAAMWERWGFYIKRRNFERRVLVIRRGARGDVLLVTPALASLRKKWPQAKIHVQTAHPEMLSGVANCEPIAEEPDHVFNLDSAYERRPGVPIVEAFADACGVTLSSHRPIMKCSLAEEAWARTVARGRKVALIHPGPTTWAGKNWPEDRFSAVVGFLKRHDFFTIAVGGKDSPACGCDDSICGMATPQQLYALALRSSLFVGVDSMPQHVASAANLRSVVLFGATDPDCIVRKDLDSVVIQASRHDAECVGAHGRRTKAVEIAPCNGDCMRAISVDLVIGDIEGFIL